MTPSRARRLLAAALLALPGCGRTPEPPATTPLTQTLYELNLTEPLTEQGAKFFGEKRAGLFDAVRDVRRLLDEPLAKGLFVRLGPMSARLADVDEWAEIFDAFRAQKRPVHCHFDALDNGGYALAAHCDRVSMSPPATLELVGLSAQVVHGRELLEMLGVRAELIQMGKYKGAAEPFTRDTMSEELRTSLDQLLDDLDGHFRAHLARRLKGGDNEIERALTAGPYSADLARKAGLVDALAYDDEARARAKTAAAARVVKKLFETKEQKPFSLRDLLEALSEDNRERRPARPHLGVVFLVGEILDAENEALERVSGTPFVNELRRLGDDSSVRAVVLRIESPGGSALASDRMWHAVRRVAKRKPVIVSLGDMAASGGYYVASAGTKVIAEPSSIVGSIGVVGGKMVIAGLADKVGVNVETLKKSDHATWLSPFTPFDDAERARLEGLLRDTYERFLARVSEGRGMPLEKLLPAAEGRVMGGERARELGLVDELGGLARALELARTTGKLPKDAPFEVWPAEDDPVHALSTLVSGAEASAVPALGRALAGSPLAHSLTQGAWVSVLVGEDHPILTALPFALSVR